MFFVVDKPRLQRMIAIVREDRTPRKEEYDAPFLCLKATENELTVSGDRVSAAFPATVYEPGVLFIRTTKFRRVLQRTRIEERFLSFQFTAEGLRFCDVLFPFDMTNMVFFPDAAKAPESWPLSSPAVEAVFPGKEVTERQLTMFGIENEHSRSAATPLKYTVTEDEWPIIKAAKLMLHKLLRSAKISQKEVLSVCKVLCVLGRLPETSEDLSVGVTLHAPSFGGERDGEWAFGRWWRVEVLGKEIRIESWSSYYTIPNVEDGTYAWSTLRMDPGWGESELIVDSVGYDSRMYPPPALDDYPEEMEGLDWSLNGYEFEIEDESVNKRE